MRHLWRLVALRHLLARPGRSAVTALGGAIAAAGLVAIVGASGAVLAAYQQSVAALSGRVDLEVGTSEAPVPEALLQELAEVPGVAHVSAVLLGKIRDVAHRETLLAVAVDPTGDTTFRPLAGAAGAIDPLAFLNCQRCVLLGRRYAEAHQIAAGSTLRMQTPQGILPFHVSDLLDDDGVAQAYGGNVAVLFLDAAQPLFSRVGLVDRIDVAAEPGVALDVLAERLARVAGPGVPVAPPARRSARNAEMMARFRDGLEVISLLALAVSMLMVLNTTGIAVSERRREIGTLRALGVSRAAIRAVFVGEALALAALGCAVGVPLGQGLAASVLARVQVTVASLYVDIHPTAAKASPRLIAGVVCACLGASAVAALWPAQRAARLPPALTMRRGGASTLPALPWRLGLLGAALCALAAAALAALPRALASNRTGEAAMVLVVGAAALLAPAAVAATCRLRTALGWLAGVTGLLAADNLRRDGPRATVAAASLGVGLALALGCATFVSGFERSVGDWLGQAIPADLIVTGGAALGQGSVRLDPELAPRLAALPGVLAVESVATRRLTLEAPRADAGARAPVGPASPPERRVAMVATDMATRLAAAHFTLTAGALGPPAAYARERQLLASDNLATQWGLVPGQTLVLPTPHGPRHFRIAATYVDYTSDYGAIMLDRRWILEDFNDAAVDAFELGLAPGTDPTAVRAAIGAAFAGTHDLFVITNAELRARALEVVRGTFAVTSAMSVLAVIIALLGIMTTLVGAVLDRSHELAILRAVGASRAAVVRLFVLEAALVVLAGGALGMLAGQSVGVLFVDVVNVHDTGWHVGFHPPWAYQAGVLAATLAVAMAAAVVPAAAAARRGLAAALAED